MVNDYSPLDYDITDYGAGDANPIRLTGFVLRQVRDVGLVQ